METVRECFKGNEKTIRDLQAHLNKLVAEHGSENLLHPEIVRFSQLLDKFIAIYTSSKSNNS